MPVGLVVLIVVITLIGALTAGLLGRWLLGVSESVLNRMPILRSLYNAIKQLLETVLSDRTDTFKQAVLVQYPRKDLWAIAFVTANAGGELKRRLKDDYISVFLPTTPNPTSGFLLFVPIEEVIELDMTVEEAVKMVISAGIVTPKEHLSGAEHLLAGNLTPIGEASLWWSRSRTRRLLTTRRHANCRSGPSSNGSISVTEVASQPTPMAQNRFTSWGSSTRRNPQAGLYGLSCARASKMSPI